MPQGPKQPGKGGGGNRRKGQRSESYRDARRDVMLTIKPVRREIRRTRRQGVRDYRQGMAQVGNIYGALGTELGNLQQPYQDQSNQIASDLQGQLGGLTGMLGSTVPGVPQGEITAGTGLFGALGAGGLEELASQRGRNLAYNTSARRQGAEENMVARRNMTTDKLDFLKDLAQQRIDLMKDVPALIKQRMDELEQMGFDRRLALREFQLRAQALHQDKLSNEAYADYLNASIGLQKGKGKKPRRKGGK